VDTLVLRLLAKEPRARFGHAGDVAAALARLGARDDADPAAPRPRAYLYRPGFAGRAEPMSRLEAALSRLQRGDGGMALVAGESGVGKTRLLMELARQAAERKVLVLAGECLPGAAIGDRRASSEPQISGSVPGSGSGPDSSGLRSARAAHSVAHRSQAGRATRSEPGLEPAATPVLAAGGGPLAALRKPLQRLADRCRERGAAETDRLLGRRGKLLAAYEPALAGLPGQERYPEPAELPADAARLRLFHFLAETLAALAEQTEVLLILDDLQWADELTLGFLKYWLRLQSLATAPPLPQPAAPGRAPEAPANPFPVLIVGAYRAEEVDTGPTEPGAPHASPLRGLIESSGVARIDLGRLNEPAVASIVGDMLALSPAPPLFSRYLARHSEGNPFFVAEYLRAMIESGADGRPALLWRDQQGFWQVAEPAGAKRAAPDAAGAKRAAHPDTRARTPSAATPDAPPHAPADAPATEADYEALPLPRTLRELVGRRLEGLSQSASRLVEAAAVLGRESDLAELGPMLRLGERRLYDALDDLLRRQVLEVSAPGRLRFVHDKIREVAHANLRKARRKTLHRAAARSIESLHVQDLTPHEAALAHHWEQAAAPEQARPHYLAAARHATKVYDHPEAERLYRAYLRLVPEPTAESIEARTELAEYVLLLVGRSEEALAEQSSAVDDARQIKDRHGEATCMVKLGDMLRGTARPERGRQLFEKALSMFRGLCDRQREGWVLGHLGLVAWQQGRLEEARQLYEQALAIASEGGNRNREGSCLNNLGLLCMDQGRPAQAQRYYEQSLAAYREAGNRRAEGELLGHLGIVYRQQGRPDQEQQLQEQALAIARQVGDRPLEGFVLGNLGVLHATLGQLEKSQQFYEQALAIARQVGNRQFEGIVLGNLGAAHVDQGRLEEGRQWHQKALTLRREVGDRRSEGISLMNLANLERLASADLKHAARLAEQAEALLTATNGGQPLAIVLCEFGHTLLAEGRSAREYLQRAQSLIVDRGLGKDGQVTDEASKLRRAIEAFEAGEHHRLFRGMLIEDIPEGLRRWLRETGQLPG
jgi:predicted ATPase